MYFTDKKTWIIIIVCVLVISIGSIFFGFSKKAIHIDELHTKNNYILVQVQYSTPALWQVVGDNGGYYEKPLDITLKGIIPKVNYNIQTGNNIFVCYGNYEKNIVTEAGYATMVFKVVEWDILYPIQHNSILSPLLSKNYLYPMEMQK